MVQDPVDPDISLAVPAQRRELREHPGAVLAAISLGGVCGALGRYGVGELLPHAAGQWAWSTWSTNMSGCLFIGVLMALIDQMWPRQRLIRPFVGVGVLGGYTTFSTATVDVVQLVNAHRPGPALLYLAVTVLGALIAVTLGSVTATAVLTRGGRRRSGLVKLSGSALRLTIFVGESDHWHHKPVSSEIVRRAHAAGLAGATVLRGAEGFGASNHIHTTRILSLSDDLPMVIVLVDEAEKVRAFLPELDELVGEGLVILDEVEVIRYVGRHS